MVIGPRVSYDSDKPANVSLGPAKNNLQVCASFHCHPPYYKNSGQTWRPVGPSDADIDFAIRNDLPGILYDYFAFDYVDYLSPYEEYVEPEAQAYGPIQRSAVYY